MGLELDMGCGEFADWHGYILALEGKGLLERHIFRTTVAGVHHHLESAQDPSFAPGSRFTLRPETENPHHRLAVSVWTELGDLMIGCIPNSIAGSLHECKEDRTGLVLDELLEDSQRVGMGILVGRETLSLRVVAAGPHAAHAAQAAWLHAGEVRSLDLIHQSAHTMDPVEQMARMLEQIGGPRAAAS